MKRPFKFRVWDKILKKFISWNCFISFDNEEYIIQQYTGQVDKNSKEIYEGDIVRADPEHFINFLQDNPKYTAGEIRWSNTAFKVCQSGRDLGATFMGDFAGCNCCPCGLEVIGNVLENLSEK